MSINSSINTLTPDVDTTIKIPFVSHNVRKPEYKEFAFEADRNERQKVNLQDKVASFWKEIDRNNYAAPRSSLFKPTLIKECVDPSDDDDDDDDDTSDIVDTLSLNDDERKRKSLMNQKWAHTLCLFKKRGLDKLALAARPKLCNRCDTKFTLEFSDEVCRSVVADYGEEGNYSDSFSTSSGGI